MSKSGIFFMFVILIRSKASSVTGFDFQPRGEPTDYIVSAGVSKPYKVISQEYHSQSFPLLPGQLLNLIGVRFPMPNGTFAIVGLHGGILRDDGRGGHVAVPLSEVFNHHWTVENGHHTMNHAPNFGPRNGPNFVVGIPSEARNSPWSLPKGHGIVVKQPEWWMFDIHLIRTDSGKPLLGDDGWRAVKECIECHYHPSKGIFCNPETNGTLACCGGWSNLNCLKGYCFCPLKPGTPLVSRNYVLKYTLNYTRDLDAITPIEPAIFATPNRKEYNVYENNKERETLSTTTYDIKSDAEVIGAVMHLHNGGINFSYFVNDERICTSYAVYGSKAEEPGNELGHLVKMSSCNTYDAHGRKGVKMKAGDKLRLDAWYWVGSEDKRIAPFPGGTHLGVMAYLSLYYKVDKGMPTQYLRGMKNIPATAAAPTLGGMRNVLATAAKARTLCNNFGASFVKYHCSADLGFTDQCNQCGRRHDVNSACMDEEMESACLQAAGPKLSAVIAHRYPVADEEAALASMSFMSLAMELSPSRSPMRRGDMWQFVALACLFSTVVGGMFARRCLQNRQTQCQTARFVLRPPCVRQISLCLKTAQHQK
jgi:hypothetical protein